MIDWNMTLMAWTHLVYLAVTGGITIYVGRSLKKHGQVVAGDGNDNNPDIVEAFASLLEVGFYMLSFGAVNLALKSGGAASSTQTAIEVLSTKVGVVLLVLGLIYFVMTLVFASQRKQNRPPAKPQDVVIEQLDRRRQPHSV